MRREPLSSLLALRKPNLKLSKHPDDLLRRVYLPGHIVLHSEFRNSRIRSIKLVPLRGAGQWAAFVDKLIPDMKRKAGGREAQP